MSRHAIAVVVRSPNGLGFRLAGARVCEVDHVEGDETGADSEASLDELAGDPSLGVIAVEEELLPRMPRRLRERTVRDGLPIVLPFTIPRAWAEKARADEYVGGLLHRAVGYRVRITR